MIRGDQDGVLAVEPGEEGEARDGEGRAHHGQVGPLDFFPQAAHVAHVLLARERVDHAARSEEQEGLEEGVGHQVVDAGGKRADADADEHVAELRDGGVGENLLDIVLRQADGGGEERGGDPDDGDHFHRGRRVGVDGPRARGHVDAGGHHGGGVDEGGNGRGAGHGVRQPDVQGNLGGLSAGAQHEQQPDGGQRRFGSAGGLVEHGGEIERPELLEHVEHGQRESEIADAVHDECFVAGIGGELLIEVEPDQQVAAEAHAFPPDKQNQVVGGQHQHQHEEHEEVEVREEAVIAALVRHVADGVDVDQGPDAGDYEQHHGGETVHRHIATYVQGAALDPGEVVLGVGRVHLAQAEQRLEDPGEREEHAADGDRVDHALGEPAAEQAVDQKAGQRQDWYEPELHQFFIESTSSIFNVARFLNTVRIIASPTAASAAATTITKKVKRCPSTCFN